MLIARFDGVVNELRRAYDAAHALIMERGGAAGVGELRHHCAIGDGALYIIGVWESEVRVRTRWTSDEFEQVLTSVGFPSPKTAEMTILELHVTEPPLDEFARYPDLTAEAHALAPGQRMRTTRHAD
jgi:hypothetical protein